MSTYAGGRGYYTATRFRGRRIFILSHEAKSTEVLFNMVLRFHDNCPEALRPTADVKNRRELRFAALDSEYGVGTAGNPEVGRGMTIHFFHGSEVACWERPDEIKSGIFQAIPRAPGTEILLESTGRGPKGMFYEYAMEAMEQKNEYEVIFVPWFWQREYRAHPPADFELTSEEQELARLYALDEAQIFWRRLKISELREERLFRQEYPNHLMEAFQFSGETLIDPTAVEAARKVTLKPSPMDPKILGVDPGRKNDPTAMVLRQGRCVLWYRLIKDLGPTPEMRLVSMIQKMVDEQQLDKVFIDFGQGYGTIDRLRELGYQSVVQGVFFGEGAEDRDKFKNKRTEMAVRVRDWLHAGLVDIPDKDEFAAELLMVPDYTEASGTRLMILPPKEEIREKFGKSTNVFDALCLTFAYHVRKLDLQLTNYKKFIKINKGISTGPLSTRRRVISP